MRILNKMLLKSSYWAYRYAMDVKGADLGVCLETVKVTWWEEAVRNLIIA